MGQPFEHEGVLYEDLGNGQVRVVGYATAPVRSVGVQIGQPKPPPPDEAVNLAIKQQQLAKLRRDLESGPAPNLPQGYRMGAGGVAERIPGLPAMETVSAPKITANVRQDAINAYNNAGSLERIAGELEGKFKVGPGATSGIAGLLDYLPTGENKAFNDTAYQARGYVKQGLGFTGGEGNTIGEIGLNYGPFLPEAGDRDEQIVNKIAALRKLAEDSRKKAVATLGGVPDANGQVTPAPTAPNTQKGTAYNPAMAPSANGYREVPDADASAMIDRLVRSGVPFARARAEFRKAFPNANSFAARDYNAALGYARKHPAYKGSFGAAVKAEPLNAVEEVINSVGNNGFGAYGVSAANALTAGTLDELSGNQGRGQFTKDMLRRQNPGASLAGDITGSALGMVGVNAGLRFAGGRLAGLATRGGGVGGDALYGAALGAGESNDDRLMGALTGAGAAAAGNLVGRGLVTGAGRVARGVQDPSVGYLTQRGVPLTPGQVLGEGGMFGRAVRGVEDKLTSVPLLGDAITTRRAEGLAAFNRKAINDALRPIGQQVEGKVGQGAIGQAQDAVSDAYGRALKGVRLRADPQFIGDVSSALEAGRSVPVKGSEFDYLMREQIGPLFGQGGTLDGARLQAALQTTAKTASDFAKDGPMGQAAASATRDIREALTGLAGRQAPEVMPQVNAANRAYRNLSILEDASLAALNGGEGAGVFTAAQLGNAMKANSRKFGGKRAAARGEMPFSELQEAGQATLPSTVPNSGTVDRAWGSLLLPGALGGAAYGADQLEAPAPVVASLAALAALSSKPGSAAFQRMAVNRSEGLRNLGDKLLAPRRRRVGGMFGGSLFLPFVGE